MTRFGDVHPLVPFRLALGGSFAFVALLVVVGLHALLGRRPAEAEET